MTYFRGPDPATAAHAWQAPPPGWWQAYDGRWYPPAVAKRATVGRLGDTGTLSFHYDQQLIDALKALRLGAYPEPDLHCWLFPFDAMRLILGLLDAEGYETHFEIDLHKEMAREAQALWATNLLESAPEHLRRAVYTALARVLHPDVGGDAALMQALNDAWRIVEARGDPD